jgi:hypothetical protein
VQHDSATGTPLAYHPVMRLSSVVGLVILAASTTACGSHDPARELALSGMETYWIVDSPEGGQNYIAPAVRFHLKNVSARPLGSIDARARFPVPGQEESWGSIQVAASTWSQPLEPGQEREVTIRSVGRYHAAAPPADLLRSPGFVDPTVEVYVRIGSSHWARLATGKVERRIGAPETLKLGAP